MLPLWPSNTRPQIEEIIGMIGRNVTFYTVASQEACPFCVLDPITNTSTDSYCPTCSGDYWINIYSGWTVLAHVTWGQSESKNWMTGGMLDDGTCQVKVMHTPSGEGIIYSSQWVDVDGREMDIERITLRGVPEVNRILVRVKEKER